MSNCNTRHEPFNLPENLLNPLKKISLRGMALLVAAAASQALAAEYQTQSFPAAHELFAPQEEGGE